MEQIETRIRVSNLQNLTSFYEAAFKPAGIKIVAKSDDGTAVGFGYVYAWGLIKKPSCLILVDVKAPMMGGLKLSDLKDLKERKVALLENDDEDDSESLGLMEAAYIGLEEKRVGAEPTVTRDIHIRFAAPTWEAVNDFEKVTIAAGAKSIFPASSRPKRGWFYYGAVVQDPDGRTVEMACNVPRYMWLFRIIAFVAYVCFIGTMYYYNNN